eukprot:XP_027319279.1 epoxide hydrolase 4 isoform X1 [Anas platyrhynchos]
MYRTDLDRFQQKKDQSMFQIRWQCPTCVLGDRKDCCNNRKKGTERSTRKGTPNSLPSQKRKIGVTLGRTEPKVPTISIVNMKIRKQLFPFQSSFQDQNDSGLRFHYVAAGERGKPLMLLLHGFPEFWYSWRHQLREFKSEYRVVALDLRGYGETDAPSHKENYKLDCLITDIKDILESLGYNKCVLIGHDWGGMIAWLVAICYPEMVTKLIVVNFPHPSVFTEYILRHPSQLIKSAYYFFFQMPWFPEFMFTVNDFKVLKSLFTSQATGIGRKGCRLTAEDIEAYLYVFSQPGALTGPINHYRNIFSCLPLQHHEVTMPTLLLWGEKDAFMEVDMAEITRIYVKNHFRLTILSEASHWLQQDQPDIVNKLIWTFLKEETRKRE